ncbi:MAG TPA: hypothetical protein EYQ68_06460 [Cytophagales bacterium]|nr:hypothetical protein [Cytophagales bacterium]
MNKRYTASHKIRVVTAASLFDGHDAAIHIMRRVLQDAGAEVIHLGHNRSARDVAMAAIQEDAQAVAISSYQGGHMEYFKYMRQKLDAERAADRRSQVGSGDRSERIRTYNYPQGRVTDHRINLTLYKLDEIVQGELSPVIEPLIHEHQANLLAEMAGQ